VGINQGEPLLEQALTPSARLARVPALQVTTLWRPYARSRRRRAQRGSPPAGGA